MSSSFALIGDPVAGSPSPAMHRAAFREAGLDHRYEAVRIPDGELESAWPELRTSFLGLNVTIPHKEPIIPLLDALAADAAAVGSVNTVVLRDGRALGHSTDGEGFLRALRRAGHERPRRAVVLGAGGAARAVAGALMATGTGVSVANRTLARAQDLAGDLGAAAIPLTPEALAGALDEADLLVNATSLGSGDPRATPLPDEVPLHPRLVVFDLVYRPSRTRLLRRAATEGCRTVEGIEMLIEQGARSFEIWTGRKAPVPAMRRAAARALGEGLERASRGGDR